MNEIALRGSRWRVAALACLVVCFGCVAEASEPLPMAGDEDASSTGHDGDVDPGDGATTGDASGDSASGGSGGDEPEPEPEPEPVDPTGGEMLPPCLGNPNAIVTDIDATLTTSDAEFAHQVIDGNYDPQERNGAAELISAYADRGYFIVYLTARSELLPVITTGESSREATDRWLHEHGFPRGERTELILAETLAIGGAARTMKAEALAGLEADGLTFDYAYGNAQTDIEAYEDTGIPKQTTFIIGPEAGTLGTQPIAGEDYVDHFLDFMPSVPTVCTP